MIAPQSTLLPDGKRLHLQHGPIDLVVEAYGTDLEITKAYHQAEVRFQTILTELVTELPSLRRADSLSHTFKSSIAQDMQMAIKPFFDIFVTPMAAVAGAVAQHVLGAMTKGRKLEKAYVNNGGDIALYLNDTATFDVGVVANIALPKMVGKITLRETDKITGIATSGWGGRSMSFGIADAVTVLAGSAAEADVAATLIANHVTLHNPAAIKQQPASELDPDSDLGERLVTVGVDRLSLDDINKALDAGALFANQLLSKGVIKTASLCLNDEMRIVGDYQPSQYNNLKEITYA